MDPLPLAPGVPPRVPGDIPPTLPNPRTPLTPHPSGVRSEGYCDRARALPERARWDWREPGRAPQNLRPSSGLGGSNLALEEPPDCGMEREGQNPGAGELEDRLTGNPHGNDPTPMGRRPPFSLEVVGDSVGGVETGAGGAPQTNEDPPGSRARDAGRVSHTGDCGPRVPQGGSGTWGSPVPPAAEPGPHRAPQPLSIVI